VPARARGSGKQPAYGFGWKVLGAALQMQGKDALQALTKAAELLPDDAEAVSNLAVALQGCKELDKAEALCRRALTLNPNFVEAHNNLGNILKDLGQIDAAMASYSRALQIKPDYAEVHNNLGNVLREIGRFDEAIASYALALQIKPDYAEAHCNLGHAFKELGRLSDAEAKYRHALALKPGYTTALNNLAVLSLTRNEPAEALKLIVQSLGIQQQWESKTLFAECIKRLHFTHCSDVIRFWMVHALAEPWARPTVLAKPAAVIVKLNPSVADALERATEAESKGLPAVDWFGHAGAVAAANDELFLALLEAAPILDTDLEKLLTQARRSMLNAIASPELVADAMNFYSALAQQCFINEYIFSCTDQETIQIQALRDILSGALEAEAEIHAGWVLALAAYEPLHTLAFSERLLTQTWPEAVTKVLVQQLREPMLERELRKTIPRLTVIDNNVSVCVQQQYEENPYPRWIKPAPAGTPVPIDIVMRQQFPLADFKSLGKWSDLDILIAGCGTGQQSIGAAQKYCSARILAVDLSMTSLCYAKRKTQELGIQSIEYAQADILQLASLGRSFDVIESCGVLHHLEVPFDGWRVLLSLLRPGGFMRLGFYSEVARRDIVKARTFIAERGYGSNAEDIRRCRQEMMTLKTNSGFESVVKFGDFYALSACRDLLFHVQEHRMTLSSIGNFIQDNRLQFLGFEMDVATIHAYRQRYPDDPLATTLANWDAFESENPDTFLGMYQFWVQKK